MMTDYLVKIVFCGDAGVGKTCLLHQFVRNSFLPVYQLTLGVDFEVRTVHRPGLVLKQQIWDLGGNLPFRTIVLSYFRSAWIIVIIYDVTTRTSFESIVGWLETTLPYSEAAVVIVGNKVDGNRTVGYEEGAQVAREAGAIFLETSAASAELTTAVFKLVDEVAVARARREQRRNGFVTRS